jgi:hypothetical protein
MRYLLALSVLFSSHLEGQIVSRVLSPGTEMSIALSPGIVTVLKFPLAVSGAYGGGLVAVDPAKPDAAAIGQIAVQHRPGSPIVLLEPLITTAHVLMTCLCGQNLYLFDLRVSPTPDVAVTLLDKSPGVAEVTPKEIVDARPKYDPELLVGFLRRARDAALLKPLYPDLYDGYQVRKVKYTSECDAYKTTVTEVNRFSKDDAIVVRGTVQNKTDRPLQFDGRSTTIQVVNEVHPAKLVDVLEPIPAGATVPIDIVIQGDWDGSRANLAIDNEMRIILPSEGTVWSFKNGGPASDFKVPPPFQPRQIPLTQTGNALKEKQ